jgi:hypothetical protein
MNNTLLKYVILCIICIAQILSLACCKEPCSSSVEIGMHPPNSWANGNKIKLLTWEPITLFPRHTNKEVTGFYLEALRPYLPKAEVTNYSDVEVRGITVVFYWASFGLFDRGTPIGAVAVDLPPKTSKWVRGPWSFILSEGPKFGLCLSVRVFHPCDTNLENNDLWRNWLIVAIDWPLKAWIIPFVVDFTELEGPLSLKIDAPDGINAYVIPKSLPMGEISPTKLQGFKAIKDLRVQREIPQELSLVIENTGARFKPGDSFNINVAAMQDGKEVSNFTVQFDVKD